MSGFSGLLFGPGRPPAGEPVRGAFVGTRLQVDGAGTLRAEASAIAIEASGFDQDDLLLSWTDAEGRWGLLVTDAPAKRTLLAAAPAALAQPLHRWRRGVGISRGIWRTLLGSAAALVVGLGLLWWHYDAVIAWGAAQVSPETERRLGQGMIASVVSEGRSVESGDALDAIQRIGAKLTVGARHEYRWYLLDDPQVNAFALPGGFIVVNTGLVDATTTADELAAVLAHEVQHVELRHSLQQVMHQLSWATVLMVVLGDPSAVTSLVLLQAGSSAFSRELEEQADVGGVAALRRAGIPPAAMAAFLRNLKDRARDMPALLSTHPATPDRIATVEALAAAEPCPRCAPLAEDWPVIRDSLVRDGYVKGRRSINAQ